MWRAGVQILRPGRLKLGLLVIAALAAFLVGCIPSSAAIFPRNYGSPTPARKTSVTVLCASVLPAASASRLTGVSPIRILVRYQIYPKVPKPTAPCYYDVLRQNPEWPTTADGSFVLVLWTNQTRVATSYSNFVKISLNSYSEPSGVPVAVHGVGEQAAWSSFGGLVVQANSKDMFLLRGDPRSPSIAMARIIIKALD